MRSRQVHLDFHTSEFIPHIGEQFHKGAFVETLKAATSIRLPVLRDVTMGCCIIQVKRIRS